MDKKKLPGALTRGRVARLCSQAAFLLLAPQAFSGAFSGAKSVLVSIGAGKAAEMTSFVALLLGLCAYTFVFGRFFCGYACAFGTLGDAVFLVAESVRKKIAGGKARARKPLDEKLEGRLRLVKYAVLLAVLLACALGASAAISGASPWTAFGRLCNLQPDQIGVVGGALLLAVVVGMALRERFFCEFACPMGAIFSLLPQLPWASPARDMSVCNGCGKCRRGCPVGIWPPAGDAQVGECIRCGRCEEGCPLSCISSGKLPGAGEKPKGARDLAVAVMAIILLALLWACGAVHFLPEAPWV
ncbi:4Fe-4S binding protein [Paratractidigestivibacter sp.]|uniref:4Fe-4S binding protein n=1 Tax=Paratractidigestivibacter sp. TaxID=2847316 RepID=UPI002AC8B3B7|nr:4Fe-4S binding protein [Paratractidigestivibacter sp.]